MSMWIGTTNTVKDGEPDTRIHPLGVDWNILAAISAIKPRCSGPISRRSRLDPVCIGEKEDHKQNPDYLLTASKSS